MTRKITPREIGQLRRDAKREGRQLGIPHSEALDRIASRCGFSNWSLLARHATEGLPVARPPAAGNVEAVRSSLGLPRMAATRDEQKLIVAIIDRFASVLGEDYQLDRLSLMMDIEACHSNGCPLDLVSLLNAPREVDLVHDVTGIQRHLDRETGTLHDFRPRYAFPAMSTAAGQRT